MARWRTLHEITVVATVISQHGESIAERYLAHQGVDSKKAMDKYLACYERLGYRPLPVREQQKILKNYDKASVQYGKPFKTDYGWAASHLKNDRPTFADLELTAGRADMRTHYQRRNDNVFSQAVLAEPGQNAAFTLTQLAALVCMSEPSFDDLVVDAMVVELKFDIPQAFGPADRQLRKDDNKAKGAHQICWPSTAQKAQTQKSHLTSSDLLRRNAERRPREMKLP